MNDPSATLQELLKAVRDQGASDLHLAARRRPYVRVDGELIPLTTYDPMQPADTVELLHEMVEDETADSLSEGTEVDFSYNDAETGIRFRVSAYLQQDTVSIAFRAIASVKSFEELNLPPVLKQFAGQKQGFFLAVGPVGVGKSTTLSSMVDSINAERKEHIVTIENPIEHVFEEKESIIDQREVGTDTSDFQNGLVSAFRQDADVIMIGEMRNPETISAAVTAAETGHLVFSTLHTNNASQTIDRIIDSFPSDEQAQIRAQLAGSLTGIFSQRLLPSLAGGRVPAYELLINTPAVGNIIREGRTHELDRVIETGSEEGMVSMNHSLAELVNGGQVSQEQALNYSLNPEGLQDLV